MEKRLILAIALSLLVMLSWSALSPKPQSLEPQILNDGQAPPVLSSYISAPTADTLKQRPVIHSVDAVEVVKNTVTFSQEHRDIIFNPDLGTIVYVLFKDKLEHKFPLQIGFITDGDLVFKQHDITAESISFIHQDQVRRIIKKFIIPKDSHTINLEISTMNLSTEPLVMQPQLVLGRLDLSGKNPQARFQDVFLSNKEKSMHLAAGKDFSSDDVKFIGVRDQYFCTIVEPTQLAARGYIKKFAPQVSEIGLQMSEMKLGPKQQIGHLYHIYMGPQDLKLINSIKPEWAAIIYFGTFDFIAQLLLQLLGFFFNLVHNWGVAIIILSTSVYFLLFPLSIKQMRSMKEMQLLQPKIEILRKELKDNPQRLNKEIMELYKEHKVNPLGGCLPLLLQMPIFFALYQALIRSVFLRGAHFLWIKDLSAPDKAFTFNNSLPFFGNQLNVLPILMAIGMFVQQKISMAKASGEAAQQQKLMSIIMPVMFGVIFYQMPSGLVLYWFVNSLFMLMYQLKINRQK